MVVVWCTVYAVVLLVLDGNGAYMVSCVWIDIEALWDGVLCAVWCMVYDVVVVMVVDGASVRWWWLYDLWCMVCWWSWVVVVCCMVCAVVGCCKLLVLVLVLWCWCMMYSV